MFLVELLTYDPYEYAVTHSRIIAATEHEERARRFCRENSDEFDSLNNIYKITSTREIVTSNRDTVVVYEEEDGGELTIQEIKTLT